MSKSFLSKKLTIFTDVFDKFRVLCNGKYKKSRFFRISLKVFSYIFCTSRKHEENVEILVSSIQIS